MTSDDVTFFVTLSRRRFANAIHDEYMANNDDTYANNKCTGRKHWIMFSLRARGRATSYANEKEKEAPAANASPSADGFTLAAFLD